MAQTETEQRPNVLFITCDTLRRDALGCAGNRAVQTPNVDALAARGVLFRNAYTPSPLCQPARASLITGLYPHQHGIVSNRCHPIAPALRRRTFSGELQGAGYATAFVGRHHFFDFWDEPSFDYRQLHEEMRGYGFDHVVQVNDKAEHGHLDCDYTASLREKGLLDAYRADLKRGGMAPFTSIDEADSHDAFAAHAAIEWLARQDAARPFLLWLSFGGPHPPYRSIGEYGAMYRPEDMPCPFHNADRQQIAQVQRQYTQYYGMVSQIDAWIGRVIAALEARGLLATTLVIFTSDHGDMLGDFGYWHKRRFYEQSVGVPLIVAGPGVSGGPGPSRGAGLNSPVMVETIDVYPTMLEAAGLNPSGKMPGLPGRSLFGALDEHRQVWRRAAFSQIGTWLMVRTARWKLTYDPEQGGVQQLYNQIVDPQEAENLAGRAGYEAVEAELTALLLDWLVRTTTRTGHVERQSLQRVAVGP